MNRECLQKKPRQKKSIAYYVFELKIIRILYKNQNCQQNCLAINHIKSVLLPEEGGFINFENFKR